MVGFADWFPVSILPSMSLMPYALDVAPWNGSRRIASALWNAPPSDLHQPFFEWGPRCGAVSGQTGGNVPCDSGTDLAHLAQKLHTIFWNVPKIRTPAQANSASGRTVQGMNCVDDAKGSEASCTWGPQYNSNTYLCQGFRALKKHFRWGTGILYESFTLQRNNGHNGLAFSVGFLAGVGLDCH